MSWDHKKDSAGKNGPLWPISLNKIVQKIRPNLLPTSRLDSIVKLAPVSRTTGHAIFFLKICHKYLSAIIFKKLCCWRIRFCLRWQQFLSKQSILSLSPSFFEVCNDFLWSKMVQELGIESGPFSPKSNGWIFLQTCHLFAIDETSPKWRVSQPPRDK